VGERPFEQAGSTTARIADATISERSGASRSAKAFRNDDGGHDAGEPARADCRRWRRRRRQRRGWRPIVLIRMASSWPRCSSDLARPARGFFRRRLPSAAVRTSDRRPFARAIPPPSRKLPRNSRPRGDETLGRAANARPRSITGTIPTAADAARTRAGNGSSYCSAPRRRRAIRPATPRDPVISE